MSLCRLLVLTFIFLPSFPFVFPLFSFPLFLSLSLSLPFFQLHAERTKRLGNQWEVQRGAVMEELRDTKAELHSIVVERNQLRRETEQLRGIISDYMRGVSVKTLREREVTEKKRARRNAGGSSGGSGEGSVAEEKEIRAKNVLKEEIMEELIHEEKSAGSKVGGGGGSSRGGGSSSSRSRGRGSGNGGGGRGGSTTDGQESDEEDIEGMAVRERIQNIHEADHEMDVLLLELMSEKRVRE